MRQVQLEDSELLLLDGKVNAAAQAVIEQAKRAQSIPSDDAFVREVLRSALEEGRLTRSNNRMYSCDRCKADAGWSTYKSGRNRGRRKDWLILWGVSYNDGFVTMKNYPRYGICDKCDAAVWPEIARIVAQNNLRIQMPTEEPVWRREDEHKCFACERIMWEFDMKPLMALMGDGYYYGGCPHCKAEHRFLGKSHASTGAFRMVESAGLTKFRNLWVRPKTQESEA